ncbi:unnamed protein product, partial [Nesidiocoris tenuis]
MEVLCVIYAPLIPRNEHQQIQAMTSPAWRYRTLFRQLNLWKGEQKALFIIIVETSKIVQIRRLLKTSGVLEQYKILKDMELVLELDARCEQYQKPQADI